MPLPEPDRLQTQTPSLPQSIADGLRRDILLGKILPGSTIKERDNAIELGVSRTPMREAIRILAQEGLVILRPSRSPVVAQPSLKEVKDDLAVMRALEVLSGELACKHATDEDLADIRGLHEHLSANQGVLEPVDLFEIDMAFHRAIAQASHNPSLLETHGAYLARLWRVRFLSASLGRHRAQMIAQHEAILVALEARDAGAISEKIDAHLKNLITSIAEVLDAPPA